MAYNAFHNFDPFVYAVQSDLQLRVWGCSTTPLAAAAAAGRAHWELRWKNPMQFKENLKRLKNLLLTGWEKNGWGLLMTFL